MLTEVILQQGPSPQGLLPHSHLLPQAPGKAFSFIRLVQCKLQIDNPSSLPQSIGQSQGTGPGCPQGEGMNTSRGGIRGGLITISLPVPKQTRPWYRKTTTRKKKERKQKTVQKTYFVGISLQRSHVTILAETWHSAGISEPNGALCNADWKEWFITLANFQTL